MKRVKITAVTAMMKIAAVPSVASTMISRKTRQLMPRRKIARTKAKKAPTAPASVGVNQPRKMPPRTKNTRGGKGQMSRTAAIRSSWVVSRSNLGARDGRTITRAMIMPI